jgi:hypothetical protein
MRPQGASTILNCSSPELLSTARGNMVENIKPHSQPDVFEKVFDEDEGTQEKEKIENTTEKVLSDFDELPIELISLADRLVENFFNL